MEFKALINPPANEFLKVSKGKQLIIADLQIHSRHSRATSKDITIDNLAKYAKIKGLHLIGVGDFQHPLWRKEIDEKLEEDEKGILWLKDSRRENRIAGKEIAFLWQTEISLMFSQDGKRRAVHLLIFAPNTKTADKIIAYLKSKGRVDYDGRPIFGMTCKDLVRDLKEIEDKIEIIPAHCMTPFFGLFGSKSGFDSIEECFQDQAGHIYAVESGMSADPGMLWRFEEVSKGDISIVSFSDAHSFWPWRMGREATIFELIDLSYDGIIKAIRTGAGLRATIETPPEYGKYHYDGHRNCDFSCSPEETNKLNKKCPKCGKELTIGVDYRVEEIAKEKKSFRPMNAIPYYKLVPLHELIAFNLGSSLSGKKTWEIYNNLLNNFENEFNILLRISKEELLRKGIDEKLIDLILLNREGKIKIKPGYDGVYGEIVFEKETEKKDKQRKLF